MVFWSLLLSWLACTGVTAFAPPVAVSRCAPTHLAASVDWEEYIDDLVIDQYRKDLQLFKDVVVFGFPVALLAGGVIPIRTYCETPVGQRWLYAR